ncbi:hypothetical protein CTAYLR_008325 [Chrysophaeum taylorii]|uniref:Uncharacterized protein n=1 Tax=Chrysophaeum taylorii TaxID=2483200 RepID=A0AAD7U9C3_9STRA|nr:hypothetical protein CTAYLR_008325 [Chrysophaeum taylorii]
MFLIFLTCAAAFQAPKPHLAPLKLHAEKVTAGGFNTAGEPPIEIRGFSLAKSFLGAGVVITGASFAEFFSSQGQAGLSSLGFIYGIPILLIGFALQYAELEPVSIEYDGDDAELEALWEAKATDTLKKVRQDVTRHRYGDEAHLDTTVKALGLVPPGSDYPQLRYLQLAKDKGGQLKFSMIFSSPETPFYDWADEQRLKKYKVFFGPNVEPDVIKVDADKRLVAIQLTTTDEEGAASS